jgi:hypothetical protein
MKYSRLWVLIPLLSLGLACQTVKSPQDTARPSPSQSPKPSALPASPAPTPATATPSPSLKTPEPEESFDPASITVEMKNEAFTDITTLIKRLNSITQGRDYQAWRRYLADDFIDKYSAPDYLDKLSNSPVLKRQGITLYTLEDYFNYVVYPSHQNDRVDDIEFIGHNRVKAITLNKKNERLVLWDLEKIDGSWKIGIGR